MCYFIIDHRSFGALSAIDPLDPFCMTPEGNFMKNRNVPVLLVFIMGLAACLVQAQIYSWVDKNGVKHFSDSPPKISDGIQNLKSMNVRSETDSAGQPVQNASETNTSQGVVIYTTSWCGYCKKAKAWMNTHGISYDEYDIEESTNNRLMYQKAGGKGGVPLIVVGGKTLAGWDESVMRKMLGMN
jgi:glutaredoxin